MPCVKIQPRSVGEPYSPASSLYARWSITMLGDIWMLLTKPISEPPVGAGSLQELSPLAPTQTSPWAFFRVSAVSSTCGPS